MNNEQTLSDIIDEDNVKNEQEVNSNEDKNDKENDCIFGYILIIPVFFYEAIRYFLTDTPPFIRFLIIYIMFMYFMIYFITGGTFEPNASYFT